MSDDLRSLLATLHERLSHARSVDAESRRMLATLVDDIHRALGESPAPGATQHPVREHESRVEAAAVQFEAEHPQLASVLRQVMDALGKAGI